MSQTRQLAAIMFTDIVGYTALMGTDELKAFEYLKKNREIQRPAIEKFNGKWIKELGDGVLACFNNASDAVQAAICIQEICNATKDFQLRIGIHQGDVVFEGEDIFGDTVNIASRIQCTANPGSIFISESVHQNVSNLQGIATRFVKQESLKNVRELLNIYEIVIGSVADQHSSGNQDTFKKGKEKSIAVLPFTNMSNDPEQDYFGEGIAEEIINSLVHIRDLKIAGRTSSAQFKGRNIDLREVGKKLGVNTVLEGSVRKQGNRLRITAQLINVEDGFHLWSEKFDRNMDDIFAIQDEIALAITKQLKITLFEKDREEIIRNATNSIEAYELVLKGRFHIGRRGSSILTGLHYYEQAIAEDPQYALAYSGYAWANYLMAFYNFISGREVMEKVKQNAEKAIQLDDGGHEAYSTLAAYYESFQWNWQEGKDNYLKAIALNPQFAQGNSLFGMAHLAFVEGSFDEAQKYCRIGIKMDPLSAIDHADLAWMLYTATKYEEGLAVARTGIELDANSFLSHGLAGLCLIALNRAEEAVEKFNHLMSISNRHQHALCGLIMAYCGMDMLPEAQKLMDELIKRGENEYIGPTNAAISAAHLNQIELAFEFLESAFRDKDPILVQLKYGPFVPQALRVNPRFVEMLNRMQFPD
ncbi:MAG TPA: adenylate/guanylate cyclase domain-containing protein [Cyclobacteriaceae bacterium]|nr:adenylate/guanylate cyclase domain-containing protein [Cyclobacteriaceae bacterium]